MIKHIRRLFILAAVAVFAVGMRPSDELDRFIRTQIERRQIVGLSLAIIGHGRIVEARAYGTTTRNGTTPVTSATLFQAGSISKPVSALGALRLVEAGKLSLDDDVNTNLKSWRVPENAFTTTERVTLRRLLSHTAGLNVRGFPGYEITDRIPSLPEILEGKGNTEAVRVDVVPGSLGRYSGGGYIVMQQLVEDVSHKPFAEYMRDEILKPLGMTNSTFQQPLPAEVGRRAAAGYGLDRSEVPGRWHVYPEMTAAGLWTTPTDLAKYAIGVQQALAGKSKLLSVSMARQMLTVVQDGYGLGVWMDGKGPNRRFGHNGRARGFDALLIASAEQGDGLVVMINGNDNTGLSQGNRIIDFVARKYSWPDYFEHDSQRVPARPEVVTSLDLTPSLLSAVSGRYDSNMLVLGGHDGRVYTYVDGLPDEEFVLASNDRFVSTERAVSFRLLRSARGDVEGIDWTVNNATRRIPRIGPLFKSIRPSADPDPEFTGNLLTIVHALPACSKAAAQIPLLTQGMRNWCASVANPNDYPSLQAFKNARAAKFMHAEVVAERGIERNGHAIQRVLHYRLDTQSGDRWLLIYVDPNGLVADYDLVDN